ncbi:DUF1048 domain-containing protein [Mollicutes bacterium LVI A0078]|nr:DUF1048 domain-containing protein [Mollicutes bacterium LVI A0075]WOO91597.1 DUF1048 domain-containing protein [Mollicutes bacterium LVI A0078]
MSIKQLFEEKKQWNKLQKQVKAMPNDYSFVFNEMQSYIFKVADLSTEEGIALFSGIIELFETGIELDKSVLEVTGDDVAAFCDSLIEGNNQFDEYVKGIIEKNIYKTLNVAGQGLELLKDKYGVENLTQVYPTPINDNIWSIGITADSMSSPVGMLSSGVKPTYYLYKQEIIIKVIGQEYTEHEVHNQKGDKYLADNMWFNSRLDLAQ